MPQHRLIRLAAAAPLGFLCLAIWGVASKAQTTATTATTASTASTATTGTTGTGASAVGAAGVVVDPNGVLRTKIFMDQAGQLMWRRNAAAFAAANPKAARASKLRKVSLNRLEAAAK